MPSETNNYDLSPALLRQRRNLIAVSLIILFMNAAGAKLDEATFLGIKITFTNPQAVVWFLKLFLIYFLYRYYLYLIQEPDLFLKNTFYAKLSEFTFQKVQQIKNKKYPEATAYSGDYDFRKMKKVGFLKRQATGGTGINETGECLNGEFEISLIAFIWDGLKALLITIFNRSYVTDYILPLILALAALIGGLGMDGS